MNHQLLQLVKETFIGVDFADNCVLQDFIIPLNHVKKAVELNDSVTAIYPLWLVPARLHLPSLPKSLQPSAGDVMFVDVGVYGFSHKKSFAGREKTLRQFEKFTLEHQGFQALYAETLMTFEEFCTMFPRNVYQEVIIRTLWDMIKYSSFQAREKLPLCKEAFPEVYEKVSRTGRKSEKKTRKQA